MPAQTSYAVNMSAAFAGMLADGSASDVIALTNKEASAEMPFGVAVAFEGSTDDTGALSPDALTDKIAGLLLHAHNYAKPNELGDTGLKPGATLNVLRKGRMWATCEDGCSPGSRLHVRVLAGTEGALRASADGVNTIDSTTQGIWLTTATAGNLAVLEVDFTNKP